MIFQHLEGEDLMNCEAVCRQWRDILLAGTPWRRLFDRNKEKLPLWRRAQWTLEKNHVPTFRTDQYRGVCKEILQVKRNWRTGNFKKFTYEVRRPDYFRLTIGDDYVNWDYWPSVKPEIDEGCTFLDTESMEITEIPYFMCEIVDGLLVRRDYTDTGRTVNIWNPNFNLTIDEGDDCFNARDISSGGGLIVCHSTCLDERERIEVWKMGNPPTLLRTRIYEDRHLYIWKVDERFIVAVSCVRECILKNAVTLFFISTETLEVVTSLSAMNYECYLHERSGSFGSVSRRLMNYDCQYAQGLLFQYRGDGLVRTLDVASGSYVNDVHIPFQSKDNNFIKLLDEWVSANSNVIVIGWKYLKDR
jgi:hypothetical protein